MKHLKILDRVNLCNHCILDVNGKHQDHCRYEIGRRIKAIGKLTRPNKLLITLDTEAMQEAA
jgi:hypothetical protein